MISENGRRTLFFILLMLTALPFLQAQDELEMALRPVENASYLEPGIGYHYYRPQALPYHEMQFSLGYRFTTDKGFTAGAGISAGSTYCSAIFIFFANFVSLFEMTEEEEAAGK